MKILIALILSMTSLSILAESREFSTEKLVCVYYQEKDSSHSDLSCVSKDSLAKDALQIEVLKLEKSKLLNEKEKELLEAKLAAEMQVINSKVALYKQMAEYERREKMLNK